MLVPISSCTQGGKTAQERSIATPAFSFDQSEFPGAKPWTHEHFRNDSNNFQFAILGDRGGGASALGTYERAIEQLNWLQPELVMSVGDVVEGYTTEQAEMDAQWEEFESIVAKLDPSTTTSATRTCCSSLSIPRTPNGRCLRTWRRTSPPTTASRRMTPKRRWPSSSNG
jgi:hypothetical protein